MPSQTNIEEIDIWKKNFKEKSAKNLFLPPKYRKITDCRLQILDTAIGNNILSLASSHLFNTRAV